MEISKGEDRHFMHQHLGEVAVEVERDREKSEESRRGWSGKERWGEIGKVARDWKGKKRSGGGQ